MLCFLGYHYPTPKQLQNILKPDTSGLAVRWYDLGKELLTDDTVGILDVIKADNPNDASACCNKMLVKWLELKPDATWSQIITALINIGMKAAADSVISRLIKGITFYVTAIHVQLLLAKLCSIFYLLFQESINV